MVVKTVDEKKTDFRVDHLILSCKFDEGTIGIPAWKDSCNTDSYLRNSNDINMSKFLKFVLFTIVFIRS